MIDDDLEISAGDMNVETISKNKLWNDDTSIVADIIMTFRRQLAPRQFRQQVS